MEQLLQFNKKVICEVYPFNISLAISNAPTCFSTQVDFLSKTYLCFYPNQTDWFDKTNITELFDSITWSYNSHESTLSSDFALELLRMYLPKLASEQLDKILYGKDKIYFPLAFFFANSPIFARNQLIQWKITGISKCCTQQPEIIYDTITIDSAQSEQAGQAELNKLFPSKKIPIEIFSVKQFNFTPGIEIPMEKFTQCIYWIYKLDTGKYLCPVSTIKIAGYDENKLRTFIDFDTRDAHYYTFIEQFAHVVNVNNYVHMKSLALHPGKFNPTDIISHKLAWIKIDQTIKPELDYEPDKIKQIVCAKSIKFVDLI